MFLLFLIKMFATHLKPKRRAERRVDRVSGHCQVFWSSRSWFWWWSGSQYQVDQALGDHQFACEHFMFCASKVHTFTASWFQVEQTMSLCPPAAMAAAQEGRGLRALQAQLSTNPAASQPSAPLSPLSSEDPLSQPGLPSHPPSYSEAVSTPSTPLYPCAPPKYSELPEGGSTAVIRWDLNLQHSNPPPF